MALNVDGDSLFSRATAERFLDDQLFPAAVAKEARRAYADALVGLAGSRNPCTVVVDATPGKYLGMLFASLVAGRSVYCANPHWKEQEWNEAGREIPMDAAWLGGESGAQREPIALQATASSGNGACILIPTGGTGGQVRFIAHTAATLAAAAQAQCAVLGAETLDSVSPLPPWHISGIMPVIRAMVSGGRVQLCDGSFAEPTPLPDVFPEMDAARLGSGKGYLLLSVVPTQLQRILSRAAGAGWLRQFDCVLLGGAATSPELLEQARNEGVRIGIGYGMTETAAFVAIHLPNDFLQGLPVSGTVLPHAHIRILDTNGNPAAEGVPGRVVIAADSLAEGVGEVWKLGRRCFCPQDEGFLRDGRLHLLGRMDRYIITGGEKVDPRRVETVLAGDLLVRAVLVVGEPNAEWGARVVALVELDDTKEIPDDWQRHLTEHVHRHLARHCVPKRWIAVSRLPFNERGKLDRKLLDDYLRV